MSPYRASLEERVSWTTGFTRPADKIVLAALTSFADYESGRNARPGMPKLVARADLKKRTVERSLRRLLDEGWIIITNTRHLGATTYAIVLERLATSATRARVVADRSLSANLADTGRDPLSANLADLSANLAGAVRQCGGRTRDQVPVISTQEHRRANAAPAATAADTGRRPTSAVGTFLLTGGDSGLAATEGATLAVRDGDVRADGRDREGHDPPPPDGDDRGMDGADQVSARDARVPLREPGDPPRDRRADGSGAPPTDIWVRTLARIEREVTRHQFYTWFRHTALVCDRGDVIDVGAPGERDELQQFAAIIQAAIAAERPGTRVAFVQPPRGRGTAPPIQQSFGPLALDDDNTAHRRAALVTLGEVWRAALEHPRREKPRRALRSSS